MVRAVRFLWVFGVVWLTGCAVSTGVVKNSPTSTAASVATLTELPEGEFSAQVMYQLLVAEVAGQRGEIAVAVNNYLAAAKESQDANVAERAARIAILAQALEKALEAAELWVELAPDNAKSYEVLAPLLLVFGRASETVACYERYIILSAGEADQGFMQISGQLRQAKSPVTALSVMEQLLAKHQNNPYAWLAHGQLSLRQGKLEQAMASVDKSLALKSHWAPAVVMRARILSLQGDKKKALVYLEEEREGELENDVSVGMSYARLLTEAEQLPQAFAEFERLAEQDPRNVEAQYAAGVLALQLDKLDKAETHFKHVWRLRQRRMLESSYYLGRVYEEKKDPETALKYYFAVHHGEYYLGAQSRAANLLAEQGKLARAREHLHSLRVSNERDQVRLYLVEGELLRKAGQYQEALTFFADKLEKLPNDTSLRYARALVAERADKLALAEEDLRIIIEREPGNAQALNALGYTLADRTERLDEALDYITRALEVEPKDAAIIDSMGWVQYRLGNHAKAVELLRQALSLIHDPEIAAHLGEVLWEMGNKQEALDVLETALEKYPEHKILLDAMKRLGL
ncbi:MAG: tetratricopeptide repeat protein [Gammaproteobacteria bacterium]|nr:tetratricopeptide repeat protein [Gammaproteobacteria bacterium]MCF6259887.1 tetratricopeptide repeat protein [Gammaproteobacteria bacterium]